jgi:hypothetical protein
MILSFSVCGVLLTSWETLRGLRKCQALELDEIGPRWMDQLCEHALPLLVSVKGGDPEELEEEHSHHARLQSIVGEV